MFFFKVNQNIVIVKENIVFSNCGRVEIICSQSTIYFSKTAIIDNFQVSKLKQTSQD
jgi:hypothetical protein